MADTKRLIWIDVTRAFAIILVVWGHFYVDNSPKWFCMTHDVIYSFHMPLFLFISGYLYMCTAYRKSYKEIVKEKVRRLVVPYFTVSLFYIAVQYALSPYIHFVVSVSFSTLYQMFYMPAAEQFLWFLWVLFTLFLIVPLLRSRALRLCFTLLLAVIYLIPYDFPKVLSLNCFQDRAVYFMLGVLAYDYSYVFKRLQRIPTLILLAVIIIDFIGMIYLRLNDVYFDILRGVAATCSIMVVVNISQKFNIEKYPRAGKFIMNISYSAFVIYLMNIIIISVQYQILGMILPIQPSHLLFSVGVAVVVAINIFISYMLYKVIKSNRYTAFLFGEKA